MLDRITAPGPTGDDGRLRRAGRAPAYPPPRLIPGGVAASLDALPGEALPHLAFVGPLAALRPRLRAAVLERLPRPRWLANWLIDDALGLAAALARMSGPAPLRAALGAGEIAATAEARMRLVAIYRGSGSAGRHALGQGDVAILRAPAARAATLRPAGRSVDGAPLCLVIDALAPRRGQAPNSRVSTPSQSRST